MDLEDKFGLGIAAVLLFLVICAAIVPDLMEAFTMHPINSTIAAHNEWDRTVLFNNERDRTVLLKHGNSDSVVSFERHGYQVTYDWLLRPGWYQDGFGRIFYAPEQYLPVVLQLPSGEKGYYLESDGNYFQKLPDPPSAPVVNQTRCFGTWMRNWSASGWEWVWIDDHKFVSVDEANATSSDKTAGCESRPAVIHI